MAERRYPVSGDVDLDTAPDLEAQLLVLVNATDDDLVLDCTDLRFIDSTGIHAVTRTQRLIELQGRQLRVENLTGMARRTFEILGLIETMEGEPEPA
jgi:anti-anti-sigma factor